VSDLADLADLADVLDGELFTASSPGFETVRRPVGAVYSAATPRVVVVCRSVPDVVATVAYARATGDRLVPRGGGHCFAGRSSTDGIVLDLSGLADISVAGDGLAVIGAGALLAQVYGALHASGRTLPAGCGATVGITGLTLGGGIGLLGRQHGLTCDRLVGAQVVLADGRVVDCDRDVEPDLFWGLRGAGGGQFGVVTSLRFATVPEPMATRFEAQWADADLAHLITVWQDWAPDAPDELTGNLNLVSDPGRPNRARLFGATTLAVGVARELLDQFIDRAGGNPCVELRAGLPYSRVKSSFDGPVDATEPPRRSRSEFFAQPMGRHTVASLVELLSGARATGRRELAFTAMGGAYNRVAEDATAFAHRGERFLLEHIGGVADPWVDSSWACASADGSGRVYPNFPDAALANWAEAYHAGNYRRLTAVKKVYDPHRFFDFPQAL
jgi:FAD binding domain-containing protein/berberine-like enzyme